MDRGGDGVVATPGTASGVRAAERPEEARDDQDVNAAGLHDSDNSGSEQDADSEGQDAAHAGHTTTPGHRALKCKFCPYTSAVAAQVCEVVAK